MRTLLVVTLGVLLVSCAQNSKESDTVRKQRNIRNGTLSSDLTVYRMMPLGCTSTIICHSYGAPNPEGVHPRVAAFLSAQHCAVPNHTVGPLGAQFSVTGSVDVNLNASNIDNFRILRGEAFYPDQPHFPLIHPVRVIAQDYGPIPSTRTIVGYGMHAETEIDGNQRSGTVETTEMDHSDDYFVSLPGNGNTMICPGDSGGPLLRTNFLTGVLYGGGYTDPNKLCESRLTAEHMNAVKYRTAIESAVKLLVPECVEAYPTPPPCGFSYTSSGTAACTGGLSMGNWRYGSRNWPYVNDLSKGPYCRGVRRIDGTVETNSTNLSYVGVTWANQYGTTPAPCPCQGCGFVRAQVAAGVLIYRPGEACGAGCGMPSIQDLGHMNIQVSNRINTPMNPMPMPPGTPLMAQDFDPSKRVEVTVACVPKDANCLVTNRP